MSYREDLALKLQTYSGEQMVMLTYEALIENLEEAKLRLDEEKMEELDRLLDHNREILAHLNATLGEEESEINDTTRQLYIYVNRLMTQGRIKKSRDLLQEAILVLRPLRDGWKELAEKLSRMSSGGAGQRGEEETKPAVYAGMTYGRKDISIAAESKDWEKG